MGFCLESIANWIARIRCPSIGWHDAVIDAYCPGHDELAFDLRGQKGWLYRIRFGPHFPGFGSNALHTFVAHALGCQLEKDETTPFSTGETGPYKGLVGKPLSVLVLYDHGGKPKVVQWSRPGLARGCPHEAGSLKGRT